MIVAGEEGCVDVGRVGDGFAKAVSGERHGGYRVKVCIVVERYCLYKKKKELLERSNEDVTSF